MANYKEIEVRFLDIDKNQLIEKLASLGAEDKGEELLEEVIFYDKNLDWKENRKFIRIRKNKDNVTLTYKHHQDSSIEGTEEVELQVSDLNKAAVFLERLGFVAFRHQQKIRHTFLLGGTVIDIDTWPRIPTYVELESQSESNIKQTAEKLGLNWTDAVLEDPKEIIEKKYGIPVGDMKWFTFNRFE